MWFITCWTCGHKGPMDDFSPSVADECTCPNCGAFFLVELETDDDGEDE